MFEANEEIQLNSLTARDIRIDVPMGDIATADFDRVPDTIPLGEAAALKVADRLSALAVGDRNTRPGGRRSTPARNSRLRSPMCRSRA